jgi:phenylacetate-CoA ligase
MHLLNRMAFVTHRLDDEMLALFRRRVARFRPHLITAFPTYLALYVQHCREHGWELPSPRAIISTGETLTDDNRRLFEESFDVPVFNRYGSIELGDIAQECEAHEGMHINTHRVWVEVLPVEGLEGEDGLGGIVVTDLDNRGLPLIRYDPGDLGRLWPADSTHACSCGRTLPRLTGVMGRYTDIVRGLSGRAYPQMCFGQIPRSEIPGVLAAQTIHRPPKTIISRLHIDGTFPADGAEQYRRVVQEHTNGEFDITVEITNDLKRTPTGKLRNLIIEDSAQ